MMVCDRQPAARRGTPPGGECNFMKTQDIVFWERTGVCKVLEALNIGRGRVARECVSD